MAGEEEVGPWNLEQESAVSRGLAAGAFLAATILFLGLQEIGLRLHREEKRAWWAGNGRDLLNLAGFAALGGSLRLFGYPAPAALLLGGTLTLFLFGTYVFIATQTPAARPRAWATGIGLAAVLPVVVWPLEVLALLGDVAGRLFPFGR
jgi:hypothetical protein